MLLKLPEPDLTLALKLADCLGFDLALMAELLPVGIQGIKEGLRTEDKELKT